MSLAVDAYNVAESDGNVSVCAVLLGGELVREVAVNITTTDTVGTATGMSTKLCPILAFMRSFVCARVNKLILVTKNCIIAQRC